MRPWPSSLFALLLVLAGCASPEHADHSATSSSPQGCPGHEHASFLVVVRGKDLNWTHPKFDIQPRGVFPLKAHLHQPNDWKLHVEVECTTMTQFFGYMGVQLHAGHLKLDTIHHEGETYADAGAEKLRFFLQDQGVWGERPDLPSVQARDGQRMLITYGASDAAEIEAQKARVKNPASDA